MPEFSDWQLTTLAKHIYGGGPRLSWHQRLTTIYRPLYAPFGEILDWVPPGASMLDVGCGTGALLLLTHAVRTLRKGYGVDTQLAPLLLAQAVTRDPRISFAQYREVPAEIIGDCNVITLVDIVHHLPASEKAVLLQRIVDHARPGTLVIIKDLHPRPRWRAFANRVTDYLSTRSRVDYLPMEDVQAFLRGNGLSVLGARRWTQQVWSHYLVVGRT